ncbi:MAG: hypothetical protein HON65_09130 [Rhodospirillales bacterium]|jgi:hypothetical protein|nr:hypothetical protein [Rhodospirillales bacterium]
MSFLLRNLLRQAAQKIASDPVVRDKAAKVARATAKEAGNIARNEDPSRAAGRAFKRALNRFSGN